MYKAVIFDLDGTLLNTIDDLSNAGNHVCRLHGWPVHSVECYKRMVGNGIAKLVSRFAPDGVGKEELTDAVQEFCTYYDAHKSDLTAPYEGVITALKMLKAAGVRISVLSNKVDALAGPIVQQYFPSLFDLVQGAVADIPTKPDPTLLFQMIKKMGLEQEHTLFVGDSDVDILTGKNGGLSTCGVLWGFRTREELRAAGADHIIQDPVQLVKLVTGTELFCSGQHERAAEMLGRGGLVAVPTETVYGLAADATQEFAVQKNYEAKGRPETKPLSVLVDGMPMVESVCKVIPHDAYVLAERFWPGPLTMILQSRGNLPGIVLAGGVTQGVRCPDHRDTLAVIKALGRPLACPSANLSGHPSPKSAGAVFGQLSGKIDAVLDGGTCSVGVESTILDMTVTPYRILRQGGLSREQIEIVLGHEVEAAL